MSSSPLDAAITILNKLFYVSINFLKISAYLLLRRLPKPFTENTYIDKRGPLVSTEHLSEEREFSTHA